MGKLSKSVTKEAKYSTAGLALALAISTFNEKGQNNLIIEREADATNPGNEVIKSITIRPGATIHRLEFEDNSGSYADPTQFGNNIYPKHSVNYKFSGKSKDLDAFSKVADLGRTTHLVRTKQNVSVVVGAENGLQAEKNDSGSGAAAGDANGFDMTLSGAEVRKAEIIPEALWQALLAKVDEPAAAPDAGA